MPKATSQVPAKEAPPIEKASTEDISSVEADNRALEELSKTLQVPVEQVIPTLAAAEQNIPMPTAEQVASLENDKIAKEVEGILEKDLVDIYKSIPDEAKPVFKTEGEKISRKISASIKEWAFDPVQAFEDIESWLLLIPKISKRHLEQAAKIKVDDLVNYYEDLKKSGLEQ